MYRYDTSCEEEQTLLLRKSIVCRALLNSQAHKYVSPEYVLSHFLMQGIQLTQFFAPLITQPVWTLFLFKSIWIRPQGSQGCQKMRQDPLNMPFEVWCANIAPERHKLRKIVKIGKKCQKTPVFLDIFEYSSIWGQY